MAMYNWTNLRHLKLTNISLSSDVDVCHGSEDSQSRQSEHFIADALLRSKCSGERIQIINSYKKLEPLTCPQSSEIEVLTSLTRLSSIYLGQVTFLDPLEITRIACAEAQLPSLTSIRIVDAYRGSIWGPRVRKSDVERAVMTLFSFNEEDNHEADGSSITDHREYLELSREYLKGLDRVRTLVYCEALTERIMGGDRMDES